MNDFINYLQNNDYNYPYKEATRNKQIRDIKRFTSFLESNTLTLEETTYTTLLDYIEYLKAKNHTIKSINEVIRSIKVYFYYLIDQKSFRLNPAEGLVIRGAKKPLVQEWFTGEQLEKMFKTYKEMYPNHKRSHVALGLIIYQGLATRDLIRLTNESFNLEEGTVYLKSSYANASRTLELKPFQILDLHNYLNEHQLYINYDHIRYILTQIRRFMPVKKLQHIREAVIIDWLRTDNLREVQYKAGHKYVSTTERYQIGDMKQLKEEINQFHPLKRDVD